MGRKLIARAAPAVAGSILLVGCGGNAHVATTSTSTPTTTSRPLPPNAIRVHWKPPALRVAKRLGRVCITTVKTGRFCATYTNGQIPATQLRIKLLEHGFIPVTVK